MADAKTKGQVVPVYVDQDQVLEIHWRRDGKLLVERRTCPPRATIAAREATDDRSDQAAE